MISCNSGGSSEGEDNFPVASSDWSRDIKSTHLSIDLVNMSGTANIELAGSMESTAVSLEIGDLVIDSVLLGAAQLQFKTIGEQLDIGVPKSQDSAIVTINYSFNLHNDFDGIISNGYSFTWPYFCGNVFPCISEPESGSRYQLELIGVPEGYDAIYPSVVSEDAPSYMIGWAIGEYQYLDLGQTINGTQVGVYYQSAEYDNAVTGTVYLRDVFNWLEQTYGEYLYGTQVASVSVDWQDKAYGGIEHHPYWHIASSSFADQTVHAHEAVHGWFGNGVRIACWEDFVLSEGVASYLAVRAMTEIGGEALGERIWDDYSEKLYSLQNSNENKIAWPRGCHQIDVLDDGLFGMAPYMRGAFFFRDLEKVLGKNVLDQALRRFYTDNRGEAAGMQDLLDLIIVETAYNPTACAEAWLRSEMLPDENACQ
jgi:aminopeptidase N